MCFYLCKHRIYEIFAYGVMYHARVSSTKISAFHFFFHLLEFFLNTKHEYTEKKFKKYKYKGMHFFLVWEGDFFYSPFQVIEMAM